MFKFISSLLLSSFIIGCGSTVADIVSYGSLKKSQKLATLSNFDTQSSLAIPKANKYIPPFIPEDGTVVIFSFDGGGVRAIIPATFVTAIEEGTGMPITETGDVFAGTSGGSIIAGVLSIPDENGKQKYSGHDTVSMFKETSKKIFTNTWWRAIRSVKGLFLSKYSAKPLEEMLKFHTTKVDGQLMHFTETVKPALITSFDMNHNDVYNFTTSRAFEDEQFNLQAWKIIRASTAAPTYFKGIDHVFYDEEFGPRKAALVDGGLFAMNPDNEALIEAIKLYPKRRYFVVSISTGNSITPNNIQTTGPFGGSILKVLIPFTSGVLKAQQKNSEEKMRKLMDALGKEYFEYHRVNVIVPEKCASLDDASQKNMQCLTETADQIIKTDKFKNLLIRIAEVSQENKENRKPV
jgi:uncharacterized protein